MTVTVQSKPETNGVIATLGNCILPLELDRLHLFGHGERDAIRFCFAFKEVPFTCVAERVNGHPTLALVADLGALPYTAEGADRRSAVQRILLAARHKSGLGWDITSNQMIAVRGDIALDLPLTPKALVTGAVTLLLRALPYLDLLMETLLGARGAPQPGGSVTT